VIREFEVTYGLRRICPAVFGYAPGEHHRDRRDVVTGGRIELPHGEISGGLHDTLAELALPGRKVVGRAVLDVGRLELFAAPGRCSSVQSIEATTPSRTGATPGGDLT
jgi:hypothetical protein